MPNKIGVIKEKIEKRDVLISYLPFSDLANSQIKTDPCFTFYTKDTTHTNIYVIKKKRCVGE